MLAVGASNARRLWSIAQISSTEDGNMKKTEERYVLVTTEHRGVFAGFATDTDGDVINLRAARNCIYWSMELKGFLGLASMGPDKSCRIGPAADIQIRKITAVVEVTPEAQAAWESAPWSR
jgi:hypothetical protein